MLSLRRSLCKFGFLLDGEPWAIGADLISACTGRGRGRERCWDEEVKKGSWQSVSGAGDRLKQDGLQGGGGGTRSGMCCGSVILTVSPDVMWSSLAPCGAPGSPTTVDGQPDSQPCTLWSPLYLPSVWPPVHAVPASMFIRALGMFISFFDTGATGENKLVYSTGLYVKSILGCLLPNLKPELFAVENKKRRKWVLVLIVRGSVWGKGNISEGCQQVIHCLLSQNCHTRMESWDFVAVGSLGAWWLCLAVHDGRPWQSCTKVRPARGLLKTKCREGATSHTAMQGLCSPFKGYNGDVWHLFVYI